MAPIKSHPNKTVATNIEIDIYFKSINSIHMVFLYNKYNSDIFSRKLHFVSHNLKSI